MAAGIVTGRGPAPRVGYVIGTTEGGTGRHVVMLARGSASAGLRVSVFGPAATRALFEREAESPDGNAIGFEPVAISDRPRPVSDPNALRRLRRLLIAMGADIVHAHGVRAGALAALALRLGPRPRWPRGRRPGLVVTVHNAPPAGVAAAAMYGLLERIVARQADIVLCVSSDLSSRMRRIGVREVRRAIVPAPEVSSAGRRPADLTDDDDDGRPVVLAAGRLAKQKGFDTLIAAAALWRDRRPEPVLVIAGAGPQAGALAAQASGLGVSVRFIGRRDDIEGLMEVADVFALPSRWEGQPLVLQEAMRAGRPVVATDVGGVRDLTGDDAALLVRPDDPAAFAASVLNVLDDSGVAARLSKAAAQRAAALPTETEAVESVIDLYRRLML
ncbi:MAG: glycosyltransferase family 4 protein [Streptosporangiaceae bacterium]